MNIVMLCFIDGDGDYIVDPRSLRMAVLHFRTFLKETHYGERIDGVVDVAVEFDRQQRKDKKIDMIITNKSIMSMIWDQCVEQDYIPENFALCKIGIESLQVLSC